MADFGVQSTSLAEPQRAGAAVIQGVSEAAPAVIDNRLPQGVVYTAASLADSGLKFIAEMNKKTPPLFTQLTESLSSINNAYESGGIASLSEAGSRFRAVVNQSLAASGGDLALVEGIRKIASNFTSFTTLGGASDVEKTEQAFDTKVVNALAEMGFTVNPTASATEKALYRETYAQMQSLSFKNSQDMAAFERTKAQHQVSKTTQELEVNNKVTSFVKESVPLAINTMFDLAREYKDQIANGSMSPETARNLLNGQMTFFKGQATQLSALNTSVGSAMDRFIGDLSTTVMDSLDPRITADILQGQQDSALLTQQLTIITDFDTKSAVAMSRLFKDNPAIASALTQSTLKHLGQMTQKVDPAGGKFNNIFSASNPKERTSLMDSTRQAIRSQISDANKLPAGEKLESSTELDNMVNNLLIQGSVLTRDPDMSLSSSVEFMQFVASPEFAAWKKTGTLAPAAQQAVEQMFSSGYRPKVLIPIVQKLQQTVPMPSGMASNPLYTPTEDIPTDLKYLDVFDIQAVGGQIKFVPRQEAAPELLKEINRLAPVLSSFHKDLKSAEAFLNLSIKAVANIAGEADYQKYFEENKHNIMPMYYPKGEVLKIGTVKNGKEYIGGSPYSRYSWRDVKPNTTSTD